MRRISAVLLILLAAAACSGDDDAGAGPTAPSLLDEGKQVYSGSCRVCHGPSGGGGVGPALDDLMTTFPDCDDQIRWITLGSSRWKDEVGPTYGAAGRDIGGAMPSFEESLAPDEIRLVAAWERAEFSGQDPAAAAEACGVPAPGSPG